MAWLRRTTIIFLIFGFLSFTRAAIVIQYNVDEEKKSGVFVGNIAADSGILANLTMSEKQNLIFEFAADQNGYSRFFAIKRNTGIIETASRLDRESVCKKQGTCALQLKVSLLSQPDDFFRILRVSFIINDINDNSPVFDLREETLMIVESSQIGDKFPLRIASDRDIGKNAISSYEIINGNALKVFNLTFSKTGNSITELYLSLNKLVDRETLNKYTLNVRATDGGSIPRSDVLVVNIVIVDVNDQHPTFINLPYNVSLNEDFTKGHTIVTVSATDSDTGGGGRITYSFGPNADFDVPSVFAIDRTTGAITTKVNLDYESKNVYEFTVVAHDSGVKPLSSQEKVKVVINDVNDNKPVITLSTKYRKDTVEIAETAKIRSFVVHISVFDDDIGVNGMVDCDIDTTSFLLERIEENDFKILLNTKVNREARDSYRIQMTCTDRGSSPNIGSKVITVKIGDVNDIKPRFRKRLYTKSLQENERPGRIILKVGADDFDAGVNGKITYTLSLLGNRYFKINKNTGDISARRAFNRELNNEREMKFDVTATDGGSPSFHDITSVVITILDENDVVPAFDKNKYEFNVTEASKSGLVVGKVKAIDMDEGDNGLVSYSLVPSRQSSKFSISQYDGVLKTREIFDREKQASYTFKVLAEDQGDPSRQSSVLVTVKIDDINDNRPVIRLPNNGTIQITDSFPVDKVLLRLNAYDEDDGRNAEIRFGIENSTFGMNLRINENNGEISLVGPLKDPSFIGTHKVTVTAMDSGLNALFSDAVLTVIVSEDAGSGNIGHSEPGQKNMIIIVVIVSLSTLISITLVGAIYIIHSRQKLDQTRNRKAVLTIEKTETLPASYSEQSYSSEASTASTECEITREIIPDREQAPSNSLITRLYPHCDSPNFVISGNLYHTQVPEIDRIRHNLKLPRTSSPCPATVADSRRTNHDTSLDGSEPGVVGYDNTMELRRSMRNATQQRHISELAKKPNPYTQYIQPGGENGALLA